MSIDTASADRIVLERLLTAFGSRLDGAVDFWTLVAIGHCVPDSRGFLLEHADRLRSLLIAAGEFLPQPNKGEPPGNLLAALRHV
jgi:hypothetical protein